MLKRTELLFAALLWVVSCMVLVIQGPPSALAATTPNTFVAPVTPNTGLTRFIQGTDIAGTYKTVYTAGANGSKCFSYIISHNDQSTAHYVYTQVFRSSVGYIMSSYITVIGTAGALTFGPPVDLFSGQNFQGLGRDFNGNAYLYLAPGDTLRATFLTALTASAEIDLMVQCGDF